MPDISGELDADTHAAVLSREFDATARRYDLMVGLNPGYHEHLRAAAAVLADGLPAGHAPRLLDLGCGSGASTAALLARVPAPAELVGVDASAGMLAEAGRKTWPDGVRFVHGRAEEVASDAGEWGLHPPYDGAFACYLFRNVPDRDATLAAVHDVLAPGAPLVVQEYSVAGSRRAVALWTLVCWLVIIPMSLVLTRRTALYRYLWRSVLRFDTLGVFIERLERAGFVDIRVEDVRFTTAAIWQRGILHTVSARREPA